MIREFILQLKLGRIDAAYFANKFGVDVRRQFAAALSTLQAGGLAAMDASGVQLTRQGLMQVDGLLPLFFLPKHTDQRTK